MDGFRIDVAHGLVKHPDLPPRRTPEDEGARQHADQRVGHRPAPIQDGLAGYLLSLATPLRVLSPDEVRAALLRRTRELLEDNVDRQPR